MCFVFIVEISNLLKTGDGVVELSGFDGERGCVQDGSGAHGIGLRSRSTAWVDPTAGSRIAEA